MRMARLQNVSTDKVSSRTHKSFVLVVLLSAVMVCTDISRVELLNADENPQYFTSFPVT